jgi:hypothetical protein
VAVTTVQNMLAMSTVPLRHADDARSEEGASRRLECVWGGECKYDVLRVGGASTRQEAVATAAATLRGDTPAVLCIDPALGTVRLSARGSRAGRRPSTVIMANP